MANLLHDRVFDFLESYRLSHPSFYYWLRERNTKNRLDEGFWFQGTSSYAFVGLYNRGGGSNMTRSFGLVFFDEGEGNIRCHIEVVFNEEKEPKMLDFYKKAITLLQGFEQEHKTKYYKLLSKDDGLNAAKEFLDDDKPQVDALIIELGLEELFISENAFDEKLQRVISYKTGYPGYWIFQGNPADYDIETALRQNLLQDWSVAAHKDKIKPGDKVIIWMTGKDAGCYASGVITSEPTFIKNSPDAHLYKNYADNNLKVALRVSHNLIDTPLLWSDIQNEPGLEGMNVGYRGTNFSATKKQYETLLSLINPKTSTLETLGTAEPLNQILYGPPGTGKTYHTINKAVAIANPSFSLEGKERKDIRDEYERLKKEGQIEFITFHQSMTYEDFIEGIKPQKPEDEDTFLKYKVEPGIFKIMVQRANYVAEPKTLQFSLEPQEFDKASFYKLTLHNISEPDKKDVYSYCQAHNCITIGLGEAIDFFGKTEKDITQMTRDNTLSQDASLALNGFIHLLKNGNYVLLAHNNRIKAIGKAAGDYYYDENAVPGYYHYRSVEWIVKGVDIPVSELYNKNFGPRPIYRLDKEEIKKDFFVKAAVELQPKEIKKNYVLIIDEINRGNISAIFGELITLIEDDKRQGKKEALEVMLPYSKDSFSVPSNLFIIGTMNTADRSVEALDTALRRRFVFERIEPDLTVLKLTSDGIDLPLMVDTMNKRLEVLLSKDHCIGHAWLMNANNLTALQHAFKHKILPLLQEFFYNNYSKIGLVIGDEFFEKTEKVSTGLFARFTKGDEIAEDYSDKTIYRFKDTRELTIDNFKSIYN